VLHIATYLILSQGISNIEYAHFLGKPGACIQLVFVHVSALLDHYQATCVKCVMIFQNITYAYTGIKICKKLKIQRIKIGQFLITVSLNLTCLLLDNLSVNKIFGEIYSVLGPVTEGVTEGLSKLHNEEGHNLCYSLNNVVVIEWVRKMTGCVARSGKMGNACRILIK
jgi:hypothetical protein